MGRNVRAQQVLWGLAVAVVAVVATTAHAGAPVEEAQLVQLLKLEIAEPAILDKLKADGLGFFPDDKSLRRLEQAGASKILLKAVRSFTQAKITTKNDDAVSYESVSQLLTIGIGEQAIIDRLSKSPTLFVLDAQQEKELRAAGASNRLIAALRGEPPAPKSDLHVTDFAILLDCSGSMKEHTSDGKAKMEIARQVVSDLVRRVPNGLNLTFVVYGHDKARRCNAVEVLRPLVELNSSGKSKLSHVISSLQPAGATPIALALRTAGAELAKNNAACGMVLVSDGKETCDGDPAAEAAALAKSLNLAFGIHVIGFDVNDDERRNLEAIATSGNGKYYNASNAVEFNDAIEKLEKKITVAAAPRQRNRQGLQLDAQQVTPGSFLHNAPVVPASQYKGTLAMKQAHYYQVPVREGQQIRAIGIVQKQAYKGSNKTVNQTFSVTLYDRDLNVVSRDAEVVKGNPTQPATMRATWTASSDSMVYVAIAASDNHKGKGIHVPVYGSEPEPAPYKLRIRLSEIDDKGPSPRPLIRSTSEAGRGFADAGEITTPAAVTSDLKLGEIAFYQTRVKQGEKLRVSVAVQKPWFAVHNWYKADKSRVTYNVAIYDDDQFKVTEQKITVNGNPPDAHGMSFTWPMELTGTAWVSISCDNTGHKLSSKTPNPDPGYLMLQMGKN